MVKINILEAERKVLTKEKMSKEKYKEIKSMNREQLNNFIYNIYVVSLQQSFKTIAEHKLFSKTEFDEVLSKRISDIKGIGKGKKEQIENLINQIFEDMKEITIESEMFTEEETNNASSGSRKAI